MTKRLLLLFVLAGVSFGQVIPATYFGLQINRRDTPWPKVHFGSLRMWDARQAQWSELTTAPGQYNFAVLDEWLRRAKAGGTTDVLYTLSRTPRWAVGSANHGDPNDMSCDYARINGPGQCWPPKDLAEDGSGSDQIWKDWVKAIATHVKNLDGSYAKITSWQIWNEFHRKGSFQGTDAQLVRLTEDARCVITGRGTVRGQPCTATPIDLDAIIVGPSTGVRPNALVGQKSFLDAGGDQPVDAIAVHTYVQIGRCCAVAEDVNQHLDRLRSMLRGAARSKQLWSTEFGWGKTDPNLPDPDQQAAFVARSYLLQWSRGLVRLYWYSYDIGNQGTLWREGEGLTKAGVAYDQVYRWMVGATMNKPCSSSGSVWACGFTRPEGYEALAVWNTDSTSTYTVPSIYKRYRDLSGNVNQVAGGKVTIGNKPILLETSVP